MAEQNSSSFWLARSTRTIFFFVLVLTMAGVYFAFQLPISVFPETSFPRVVIGVDNGVMPVEQMQVTITRPIEDAVNSVPGLATVRSNTSRGSAEVSLFFDWNVDMFRTLQQVDAALSKVEQTLPATAKITTNRLTFATFPILGYSLTSDTVSQTRLWELATYDIKPPLNRLPGVSTVVVQGGKVPEYHIIPNLARLQTAGITISDIVNAVQASNLIDSPGLYEENHMLNLALVGAQAHSLEELGQLVIKTTASGAPIRVSDIARVEAATMPAYTAVTADGKPAVLINISRQSSGNTVAVADAVAAEMVQLEKNLPPGVTVKPFYDQSQLVRDSIRSVRDAILIGLVLACGILFLFLRDWSSSLIAGLVIPVTVAVTILFLWITGESFNLMTLGGLAAAIGLVIDDAIVVVENIVMHRDSGENRVDAVRKAIREITKPLVYSTLTPVVVFLPLISVSGVTGSFFRALAVAMTVALLTSLVLALTWTPGLSLTLLRERHTKQPAGEAHQAGRLLTRIMSGHRHLLQFCLARPLVLGIACLALVGVSWFAYQNLGSDLLPEMDEGGFVLDYIMPAGSSLTETNRVLDHVERILSATPEVESTSRRTGLQMGLAAVTEANTGDFTVRLKADRDRGIDEVMNDVRQKIRSTEPELDVEFTQVLQDMIGDLSNSPEPIQIKLYNNDQTLLNQLGPRVADAIGKIPGVVDVENGVDNTISGPATNFRIHPEVAARSGFTPQELAVDATSILDGVTTSDPLIANGRPYTIRIRLGDETRSSLDAIENTVFNSSSGRTATLGAVAQVEQLPPQNEIHRENLQQLITVTGRLEGSDLGGTMQQVQKTIASMHLPPSVHVTYGGTYEEQQKSFHDLVRVLVLALALVFGVLLAEFRNFSAPIAILTSSVLSISGVVAALLITNTTFNVASFMGLIMVIGIVAKNGILLLEADENYRAEGGTAEDAMVHAAQRRLRPILMTALAAVCGMLPLAFALGSGSQMLQPLAIAVIGGLTISMLLSLIVTPAVYYLLTRNAH
ncbi:efflux RND transporter permease subunit [Silvibacterium dinghuense]|uniref:Efflux RND transporter permease subunit n=1 Tax=Silvibacterium dinghuense TaxID=1560006 RepID=A0A4Q1SCU9_9BACT|nr:efflux RND transporter permease subunit [Silvibacterium dinghuense]RXS95042.1 efflux RND transporter permease subunit [Silvibacterium dinghuense]GGH10084.1 multidrug ABC transporter [Silvibacterium dinghuense]